MSWMVRLGWVDQHVGGPVCGWVGEWLLVCVSLYSMSSLQDSSYSFGLDLPLSYPTQRTLVKTSFTRPFTASRRPEAC